MYLLIGKKEREREREREKQDLLILPRHNIPIAKSRLSGSFRYTRTPNSNKSCDDEMNVLMDDRNNTKTLDTYCAHREEKYRHATCFYR